MSASQDVSALLKLRKLLAARPAEIMEAKAKSRKIIGYFCSYIPEEIIWASGMIPLRLARFANNQVAAAGAAYLTSNSCPFARSCVGLKKSGTDEYFGLIDMVADAPACLQMRRVLEVWERYFGVKVVILPVPRRFYANSGRDFYSSCIEQFCETLEESGGEKITASKLENAVNLFNRIRELQRRLYAGLRDESFPLEWTDVLEVIRAGFLLDKEQYRETLEELLVQIEASTKRDISNPKRNRLLVAGAMLAPGDEKLATLLKEVGGTVVMDELCTGSRSTFGDVEKPDFHSIASRYLSAPPCGSLPYPDPESDPRHAHLKKLVEEWGINGIVYYTLRFCDAYSFKASHLKQLMQSLDVSFLHINSDHSDSDAGQIRTRIEAFVESINDGAR